MQIRKCKLTSTFWEFLTNELVRHQWREKYELFTVIWTGGKPPRPPVPSWTLPRGFERWILNRQAGLGGSLPRLKGLVLDDRKTHTCVHTSMGSEDIRKEAEG